MKKHEIPSNVFSLTAEQIADFSRKRFAKAQDLFSDYYYQDLLDAHENRKFGGRLAGYRARRRRRLKTNRAASPKYPVGLKRIRANTGYDHHK